MLDSFSSLKNLMPVDSEETCKDSQTVVEEEEEVDE